MTSETGDRARDVALLREALALEDAAVERYVQHSAATSDPRLQSYWESLRRNEAGHRGILEAALARLGAAPGQGAAQDEPGAQGDPRAGGR
jgi:rubrerythrin